MSWHEIRLKRGVTPADFYHAFDDLTWESVEHVHHFFDEPWWPGCFVVRIKAHDDSPDVPKDFAFEGLVDNITAWDPTPDESVYGEAWPTVMLFFQAGSMLSGNDAKRTSKLVHCFLNAQGMTEFDEARFAARFLWNRLTIKLRWRLYLRRRWKRRQEVVA